MQIELSDLLVKPDEPLKIEAGKEYCHKDGTLYRVYAILENGKVHGAFRVGKDWSFQEYSSVEYASTWLVAPWTDAPAPYDNWQHLPAWHGYQFRSPGGQWFSAIGKPCWNDISKNWQASDYQVALAMPSKYYPSNFTGTSESSLQERPKQ